MKLKKKKKRKPPKTLCSSPTTPLPHHPSLISRQLPPPFSAIVVVQGFCNRHQAVLCSRQGFPRPSLIDFIRAIVKKIAIAFTYRLHGQIVNCKYRSINKKRFWQGNEDLIIVHDALDYGDCRLSLAIPKYGIFENINSLKELAQMPQWTAEKPMRVATGFTYLGPKFMKDNGLKHVTFSTADGALEAAPAMGIADAIVDLVSSGTTLRENNLKEIEGGIILQSQAVVVASKKSLIKREGVLDITHEILERLEAHLRASGQFTICEGKRS